MSYLTTTRPNTYQARAVNRKKQSVAEKVTFHFAPSERELRLGFLSCSLELSAGSRVPATESG